MKYYNERWEIDFNYGNSIISGSRMACTSWTSPNSTSSSNCWQELIEVHVVCRIHVVNYQKWLQCLFTLSISFCENSDFTIWLSLVSKLVDNAIESHKVGRLFISCENFFLWDIAIYLGEIIYFEYLLEEPWIALSSSINVNSQSIVYHIDIISSNGCFVKTFELKLIKNH